MNWYWYWYGTWWSVIMTYRLLELEQLMALDYSTIYLAKI